MDLNKLAAMANKLSIPQLQQAIQSGTLPAYIGVPMLQKRVQDSKQAQAAQQAQQTQQAPQQPIAAQVMQEAQGVAGLDSNLPQEYADGGIVAFAEGSYGNKSLQEQLLKLLGDIKDEGWTEEAQRAYEPSAYQTPEEARMSMSRRELMPTEQPMTLDELTQAQNRLRAQTGLGVKAENIMEMPPYRERFEMPKPQLPQATSVSGEYVPYTPMDQSGIASLSKPSATVEGASFEVPRTTPRADTEAAKAYYAEEAAKKGYRPMSKEAVDFIRGEMAQDAKFAEAERARPVGPMKPGALGANVADITAAQQAASELVNRPASEYKYPELREKLMGMFPEPEKAGLRPWAKDAIANTIYAQANKYGIDPNWLHGLAGAESGHNPDAKNTDSTASGMFQITNATAKTIGLKPEDRFDPAKAAAATARTLDKYLKKFDGDIDLATSAWHLGPNASEDKLRKDKAYRDSVYSYMNRAPYKEGMAPPTATAAEQSTDFSSSQTPYAQHAFDEAPYKAAMTPEDELDPRKRAASYLEALGEDEGRSAREARLSKKEQALTKDRENAKWMALLQASLATMGGTSPFAMANIGAGGIAGLKSYAEDVKGINSAQDKLDELRSSYDDARRAEKRAATKYGVDSVQAEKAANKKLQLEMATDKAKQELEWAKLGETRAHNTALAKYYSRPTGAGTGGPAIVQLTNQLADAVRTSPEKYPRLLTGGQPDIQKIMAEAARLMKNSGMGVSSPMIDFDSSSAGNEATTPSGSMQQTGAGTWQFIR
jgi:hypothetical protein